MKETRSDNPLFRHINVDHRENMNAITRGEVAAATAEAAIITARSHLSPRRATVAPAPDRSVFRQASIAPAAAYIAKHRNAERTSSNTTQHLFNSEFLDGLTPYAPAYLENDKNACVDAVSFQHAFQPRFSSSSDNLFNSDFLGGSTPRELTEASAYNGKLESPDVVAASFQHVFQPRSGR
jgi:hypothetical protein